MFAAFAFACAVWVAGEDGVAEGLVSLGVVWVVWSGLAAAVVFAGWAFGAGGYEVWAAWCAAWVVGHGGWWWRW